MEFRNRDGFLVRKAFMDDIDSIMKLLKGIARWMKENEIHQWQFLLQGGDDEEIIQAVKNQDTYLILNGNEVVATFTLSDEQSEWDKELWGENVEGDSLYLHRLAVNRSYMNKGIGKDILSWIQENGSFNGKDLKLDCVASNQKLNQFYRENGFAYVGETNRFSKYQKQR